MGRCGTASGRTPARSRAPHRRPLPTRGAGRGELCTELRVAGAVGSSPPAENVEALPSSGSTSRASSACASMAISLPSVVPGGSCSEGPVACWSAEPEPVVQKTTALPIVATHDHSLGTDFTAMARVVAELELLPAVVRPRRRARAQLEPESEPEGELSGDSDSERDCALAPQLKRLKLNEDDMMVDTACGARSKEDLEVCSPIDATLHASMIPLAVAAPIPPPPARPPSLAVADTNGPGGACNVGQAPVPAPSNKVELWRAELQRRAQDELLRYRQEVRNREVGMSIRACPGL